MVNNYIWNSISNIVQEPMHFSSESLLSMSQSEYMLLRNDSG